MAEEDELGDDGEVEGGDEEEGHDAAVAGEAAAAPTADTDEDEESGLSDA